MSAADHIVERGHLDTSKAEIRSRAWGLDAPLVQNVARFLCVADGQDPNASVYPIGAEPMVLGNGKKVVFTADMATMWMLYADQARLAVAAVDMARENLADNGDEASGRAELAKLTVDPLFAREHARG